MEEKRYRDLARFFRQQFGERVQKLSLDGGFSCPNRDGAKGRGGCTYCNNESFNPAYCREAGSITAQLQEGVRFFGAKYKGQRYLAYFQAYSNTYAPLEVLKARYEEALAFPGVVGLVIATRPDAVTGEILDYIATLAKERYVCIEYGVESVNEEVLRSIRRGHTYQEAEQAICLTAERGIYTGAHLIFGLPGETPESMLEGVSTLTRLPLHVLKLHQLQIIAGTPMAEVWREHPEQFRLYTEEEYLDFIVQVIERIHPDLYLERFVNQAPADWLLAPKWGAKNHEFTAKVEKRLREADSWQGKFFSSFLACSD
ncbi:MAG: TIGR01212 family radical SAM protein [Culturomica sp.]|jgi:radical SAM protein (TIGR01212 family)|nr:TIGR01212 family radical SAM protein [Culturomica sp.]